MKNTTAAHPPASFDSPAVAILDGNFLSMYSLRKKGGGKMGKLTGKKLLLLGERDGVPGPAMEACLKGSGASIEFSVTECFV